ncbi:uncharacterized protein BDZ99DRAFT_520009 [Mytilinidion resinicola]|uniref:Mg2+ transporter protein n=1 Tax=Mytilinidion resinicola TaxID=574789 RepID=A0A6A6YM91_9PEZI|nr:uncharacterized protein BDZ99DRAFT_520009 [Mytilinidion resinicola]KAF2809910.1 hypothetical protein BDZ99DRAFT_520009 [Mytilinidion resinicola]
MSSRTFEQDIEQLHCDDETAVQYYDSRDAQVSSDLLDDHALRNKLVDVSLIQNTTHKLANQNVQTENPPPFILFSAIGAADFASKEKPLRISRDTLRTLIESCGFPHQLPHTFAFSIPHISHYVHYEDGSPQPFAISFIVRVPRNSGAVTIVSRMTLHDKACICLILAAQDRDASALRDKCIQHKDLIARYPFYPMIFLLEYRLGGFGRWLRSLWHGVGLLEEETGMTPWMTTKGKSSVDLAGEENKDYGQTLQKLHAINVELTLAETTMKFATEFVKFCGMMLDLVERTNKELKLPGMTPAHRQTVEGEIRYNEKLCQFSRDKFQELLSRVGSQINVTFSLIARQDSKTSTSIAESAARDNQAMKTITIITLVFLPSTLLATIWSSGIFAIDLDRSWRIFLGTSIGLTALVFAIWMMILQKINAPLKAAPKLSPV